MKWVVRPSVVHERDFSQVAARRAGVFVRPKRNRFVGEVPPEPFKVAETIAAARGASIGVSGAEAARRLGLTTQVPTQAVFYTTGPTRKFRIGNLPVVLKHAAPRKLVLGSRPAGIAIAALHHLGREAVTPKVVETIRQRLTPAEFNVLKAARPSMPAWMADVIYRHQ